MSLVVLQDIGLRIGGRTLIDGATLAVGRGERIGLIGRNGVGKSTLLKLIEGGIEPDGGEVRRAQGIRIGSVAQEAPSGERSLLETVLAADRERGALLAALAEKPAAELGDVHERLLAIGAAAAPARAAGILAGLGFDEVSQARAVGEFSGGWRMRVALARALFAAPDLLLLDEPSNHLDLEATLWLEGWLSRFEGAAIVVSHDQALLDRAVTAIAQLDRGKIFRTPGGFSEFVRIRSEQQLQEARALVRMRAKRAHMEAFVQRFRYKASKARQAQSRLKALEKMPAIEIAPEVTPPRFQFPEPKRRSPPMVRLDNVAAGYAGRAVLRKLSLRIDPEDRIALIGANGNGKSTFAKLLAGRIQPMSGEFFRQPGLKVGYFAQHQMDELSPGEPPLAHMARAMAKAAETTQRAQLARFGLDADRAETEVANLSGGERARLLLALATREAPELLILDEPTNHLDMDARDALVRALTDFSGAVVLIAHDPGFVSLIAERLWLVAEGTIGAFEGDLEDYRKLLAERARVHVQKAQAGEGRPGRREERRERMLAREKRAPLKSRARTAGARLEGLEAERAALDALLADPALYAPERAGEVTEAMRRLGEIGHAIAAAEEAWLRAEAALDQEAGD